MLDVPNEDLGEPIELVRYDLGTGVREHIVTVPELNGQRSVDLVLRQFAVNPELGTGG